MNISIIIPVYNACLFLADLLDSIKKQTYINFELIFINDCSTDDSLTLLYNFKKETKNKVSIINNKKNVGAAISRNIGINIAQGEYIYFMDADDTISNNCLELLVKTAIQYNKPDIICANIKSSVLKYKTSKNINYYNNNNDIRKAYFNHEWHECPVNKLILKTYLISNKLFFPNIYQEDTPWSFQTALTANSLVVLPVQTYTYRQSSSSKMNKRKDIEKIISDQFTCFDNMYKYARKTEHNYEVILYLTYICTSHMFSIIRNNLIPILKKKHAYDLQRKNTQLKDIFNGLFSTYIPNGIKVILLYRFFPKKLGYTYLCFLSKLI